MTTPDRHRRRVLVTGASGFLGPSVLRALLARDYEVHAASLEGAPIDGCTAHRCDLLRTGAAAALIDTVRPSHLVHLAWCAKPPDYWRTAENLRWLESSLALLLEFARCGGTRLASAGTCAEYEWSGGYCHERRTPTAPSTLYGASKMALGSVLERWSAGGGPSAAWGRIFFLYGPREHEARLVPTVARALLRGQRAPCSPGEQRRDFLFVDDVGEAFAALLESAVTGPVNVASGVPVAVKDVVRCLGRIVGREDLLGLGDLPAPAGEPDLLAGDVTRLRDEVGFSPRVGLEEGLARTVEFWRDSVGA